MFGNTHFNLGKKIIQKLGKKLNKKQENAFLSGMVYADIGRFKFDKETGVESDSDKFSEEIRKLVKCDEEKWFAYGFEMHFLQDSATKKVLKEIFDHEYYFYYDYMNDCGILDSYFSKKTGILYNEFLNKFNFKQVVSGWDIKDLAKLSGVPENKVENFIMSIFSKYFDYPKKNSLSIYDCLIKRTYESLGFEIDLDEIYTQAGNLLGVFMAVSDIIGNKKKISKELALKIENETDRLAEICVSKLKF